MQQSELRERVQGRRLDLDAAHELALMPYTEFFKLWMAWGGADCKTLGHAAMLRVINAQYGNIGDKLK